MSRNKSSVLWTLNKEECMMLIANNSSISGILKQLQMCPNGGNAKTLHKVFDLYGLDYSKYTKSNRGKKFDFTFISNEDLFKENSSHSRSAVKKRIIKENLIPYVCEQCGQGPIWNKKELVLVLDHINGIYNDHRLENLRFLCPNCNAQQDTFCGKHKKSKEINKEEKIKLEQIKAQDLQKKIERIKNYNINFHKLGWVEKVAKLENISHTQVRRFMKRYMIDFYKNCYARKNQFE